ncbi:MAG: hypothetical protein HYR55_20615 [Acidobacteria bacterium]|nr:hypothetical protein [Acidobacteriota bacterium]MBI3655809.1 hypothetical protein [Acidobacteriota bacterium]
MKIKIVLSFMLMVLAATAMAVNCPELQQCPEPQVVTHHGVMMVLEGSCWGFYTDEGLRFELVGQVGKEIFVDGLSLTITGCDCSVRRSRQIDNYCMVEHRPFFVESYLIDN